MENKIEEIVNAFGEEIERIVFNSNGKAKTMDLAKKWLRTRLEELVQETRAELEEEMRAEFMGYDASNTREESLSQS
jgi:hypothetical protein